MNTRTIKDGPFCWLNKEAMRLIRERFEQSNKVPVALAVYTALCEIASDQKSEVFRAKISVIGDRSGVSYKTALEYLRELEKAAIVGVQRAKIEGTSLDAPSTYTLLKVGDGSTPLCSSSTPLCSSSTPLCNGGVRGRFTDISEESEKNTEKKRSEEGTAASAAPADPTTPLLEATLKAAEKGKSEFPDPPPELANQRGFPKAWDEFGVMRRRIRKPLTLYAAELLLRKLASRPQDVVAGLEMAIENAWQGFEWEWFDNRRAGGGFNSSINGGARHAIQPRAPDPAVGIDVTAFGHWFRSKFPTAHIPISTALTDKKYTDEYRSEQRRSPSPTAVMQQSLAAQPGR